ncbi:MAG: phosphoribosylglycinamide formyltransferase [Ginsengibacter sp.]
MPGHPINQGETPLIHIAIFASGTGSNAQNIINYFKASSFIKVNLIVSNNPFAYVLKIADAENIPSLLIKRDAFFNDDGYLSELQKNNITFIVLAGFLWKIPLLIIEAYPNKIINIHPALLPKYGGKNMYGDKVHEAVIASGDKDSGITIHYVDEEYDNGDIIFQKKCAIDENETAETLVKKIHLLEHENYPRIIEEAIKEQFRMKFDHNF